MITLPTIEGGFGCIVSDPAWSFSNKGTRATADDHYKTMEMWEILQLPVEDVAAKQAHLWLWVTDAHLPYAFAVMKAWGFNYVQTIKWLKVKDGKPQMGMGNYIRHASELCLFGTRGKAKILEKDEIDFFWAARGEHSAKPDEFFTKYPQRLSMGPHLEMFARKARPGWSVWGLEAPAALEVVDSSEEPTAIMSPPPCEHHWQTGQVDGVPGPIPARRCSICGVIEHLPREQPSLMPYDPPQLLEVLGEAK